MVQVKGDDMKLELDSLYMNIGKLWKIAQRKKKDTDYKLLIPKNEHQIAENVKTKLQNK